MMNKLIKAALSAVLCLCLIMSVFVPALASERTYRVSTASELVKLAENCRLDTYSIGLTVELTADIDLTDTEFDGIATFGGTFNGNGHTISGVSIDTDGSVQGFFRYIQSGAVVRDLNIKGSVTPSGSRNTVGGFAGSNGGTLENCGFEGTVIGADSVGGIVGKNELTGIITGCQMHGTVIGNHFIGGIAGESLGVVRSTKNDAEINTTAAQNEVELSDITLETLTDSESANTVTDVGGIAGSSSGVIRDCANYGDVGYQLMGYNIGGIAGSQSGYITQCTNYGQIYGRKEVGGIVGHMEPVTSIQYTEDTLQILEGQVGTLGVLANQASANAQSSASQIMGQIAVLEGHAQTAQEAIDILIPDAENAEIPDADTILAAQNNLTESLAAMPGTMDGIVTAAENAAYGISRDLQAVSNQVSVVGETISGASENLGGTIADVSDNDTEADLLGKVEKCENHGAVLGDANAGGIAGAIAYENDLDPEEDIDIYGDTSLNFSSEIRAVILNCDNTGKVTVKKQNGGGVVGWQSLGLVKGCMNTGEVSGEAADYVGGVAGASDSFLRESSAKCVVVGSAYVGGIAGRGSIVSDCRSMVKLTGEEKLGAVLGFADELPDAAAEEHKIFGNYYLVVGGDIGAVDGISYSGCAQSMEQHDFFALEGLETAFRTVTVRFVFEDGTAEIVKLTPGMALNKDKIPEIPEKDGYTSAWSGLGDIDVTNVSFDATVYAEYYKKTSVIESTEQTEDGRPVLLVQGEFNEKHGVEIQELRQELTLDRGDEYLTGYSFKVTGGTAAKLRCLVGDGYEEAILKVLVSDAEGNTREAECVIEGSYVVFEIGESDTAFAVIKEAEPPVLQMIIGAAILLVLLIVIVVITAKRRKKKKMAAAAEE